MKRLLLAAVALLTFFAPAEASAFAGKVLIHCAPNVEERASVDPLLDYGVFPTHHNHTPAGALAFSSTSSVAEMLAAPTSCATQADHSMLWVPTPFTRAGRPAIIGAMNYYIANVGSRIREAPPDGLRFVGGNAECTGDDCPAIYICRKRDGTILSKHTIPTVADRCDTRNGLGYTMVVYSPGQCWDGRSLGTGFGDSAPPAKITYARSCHGEVIPSIQFAMDVGRDGIGGYLSSDIMAGTARTSPGSTGHFDYVFGWRRRALASVIRHCLNVTGFPFMTGCIEVRDQNGVSTIFSLTRSGAVNYRACVTGPMCSRPPRAATLPLAARAGREQTRCPRDATETLQFVRGCACDSGLDFSPSFRLICTLVERRRWERLS